MAIKAPPVAAPPVATPVAAPRVRRPFDPIVSVESAAAAKAAREAAAKVATASKLPFHARPAAMMVGTPPVPGDPIQARPTPASLADFFAPESPENLEVSGQQVMAGALAAGAYKVPVQTFVGNLRGYEVPMSFFGTTKLTAGDVADSWSTGTAKFAANGDLISGKDHRSRARGNSLASGLNDDDRNVAVIGRDWREFQLLNAALFPSRSLDLIPARDTHRIFIYKDDGSAAFNINLATTNLLPGMKFMFVNLSAAETAGTNEQQTITIDAAGGTFTITFGGQTTTALAWNAAANVVQAALEALSTIGTGNITVGLVGLVYTLTFRNALGNTNVAAVTTNAGSLSGGANTAVVATTVPGVAAIGQLVVVANGATVAGSSVNRLTLSRGAVLTLEAVPTSLVSAFGYQYAVTRRFGTIA